jgi:hypothetical protein
MQKRQRQVGAGIYFKKAETWPRWPKNIFFKGPKSGRKGKEKVRKMAEMAYDITILLQYNTIFYSICMTWWPGGHNRVFKNSGHEIRRRPPPHESLQSFLKNKKLI